MNKQEQEQFRILATNLDKVRDTGVEALKEKGITLDENSSIEDVVAEINNIGGNDEMYLYSVGYLTPFPIIEDVLIAETEV